MDFKRFLTLRPKGETSAELRAARQNAEQELRRAGEVLVNLETSQGEVLLTGSAETIEAHEDRIREARRTQTSLSAMVAALKPRIDAAEAREASAALDQMAAEAQAKAQAAARLLPEVFATMEKLAALIERHDGGVGEIRQLNQILRANGRERVPLPLSQFWARPEVVAANGFGAYVSTLSDNLVLPGPRGGSKTIKHWRAEIERAQTDLSADYAAAAG